MALSNGLALSVRVPGVYTEYDSSRAASGPAIQPKIVWLVGAMLAAGTQLPNISVPVTGPNDGDLLFGRGSQLTHMIKAAKKQDPLADVRATGIIGAGTAATFTLTFTGTATAAGVVHLYINNEYVPVQIPSGADATATALAVDTELLVLEADRMYTAAPAAGVVTLTCRHAAALGNDTDIRVNVEPRQALPPGISLVIAPGVAGATNPSVATAIANMGDVWATDIASGFNDTTNIGLFETELENRIGILTQMDGTVYAALRGNYSTVSAIGAARNSRNSVLIGLGTSMSPPWIVATRVATAVAKENDPARPFQTLALPVVRLGHIGSQRYTFAERNLLLRDGISTIVQDAAGNVSIERLITTYQTSPSGADDTAYLNLETMKTLALLRYQWNTRIRRKYPRHKLVDDGTRYGAGQFVVTPAIIRAEAIQMFEEWEDAALVEDFTQFKDELIIERNASDRDRVDMRMGPNLANQFRILANQIQFLS